MQRLKQLFTLNKGDFASVRQEADKANLGVGRIVAALVAIVFLALTILRMFSPDDILYLELYCIMTVLSLIVLILLLGVAPRHMAIVRPCTFVMAAVMFFYGIFMGAVISTDQMTVSYIVFLLVVPLVVTERPVYMNVFIFISMVIYAVIAFNTQETEILTGNLLDVACYGFASMLLSAYVARIKIQRFVLEKQNDKLLYVDQLTGIYNRRSYVECLAEQESRLGAEDVVIVAMDVNGLKRANDTLGHEAGDELLIGAAKCIEETFWKYGKCFRNGGDEFAAVLTGLMPSDEELAAELEAVSAGWSGKLVHEVSIAIGFVHSAEHPGADIEELQRIADQKMYASKAQYYEKTGIDRRKGR